MKINWTDHFVNLIVVILGITIAFWLSGWGESRKAKRVEDQYLIGLVQDLENDITHLEGLISYSNGQLSSFNSLMDAISGNFDDSDSLVTDLFKVQFNLPFSANDVTYRSLSGKIEVIDDFKIRGEIIQYYNQNYASMELWDISCKENIDDFIKPVVIRELKYVGYNRIDNNIFQSTELSNSLFGMKYLYEQRLNYITNFLTVAQELKKKLEQYKDE